MGVDIPRVCEEQIRAKELSLQLNRPVSTLPDAEVVLATRLDIVDEAEVWLAILDVDGVLEADPEAIDEAAEVVAFAVLPDFDTTELVSSAEFEAIELAREEAVSTRRWRAYLPGMASTTLI